MFGSSFSVNDFGHSQAIMVSKFRFHMLDENVIRMCENWCPPVLASGKLILESKWYIGSLTARHRKFLSPHTSSAGFPSGFPHRVSSASFPMNLPWSRPTFDWRPAVSLCSHLERYGTHDTWCMHMLRPWCVHVLCSSYMPNYVLTLRNSELSCVKILLGTYYAFAQLAR